MKEEDFKIIERKLPEAEKLFGILPGEALLPFDFKTFEILASKENGSDLRLVIQSFLRLQTEAESVSAELLCSCFLSFLQISVLARQKRETFDKNTITILGKEYSERKSKLEEIHQLTSKQLAGCESYERDKLALTAFKYEMLLKAIDRELAALNARGLSKSKDEAVPEVSAAPREEMVPKKKERRSFTLPDFFRIARRTIPESGNERQKSAEASASHVKAGTAPASEKVSISSSYISKTNLVEIPVEEKKLRYDKEMSCYMLPGFLILQRKVSFYFGKGSYARGKFYTNEKNTLFELTQINADTLQFLTQDLLNGEFQIKRFSQEEKYAMEDYFSFMTWAFEKHIGKELTIKDYMAFQEYYNRLYLAMYEEEMRYQKTWYECLEKADSCQLWLYLYGMPVKEDAMQIASRIYTGDAEIYIKSLGKVLENYGIDEDFKSRLSDLISAITELSRRNSKDEEDVKESVLSDRTYTLKDNEELERLYYDLLQGDLASFRFVLSEEDAGSSSFEQAVFAPDNVLRAVYEFLYGTSDVRKLLLRTEELDTLLFSIKGSSAATNMLTEKVKAAFEKRTLADSGFLDQMADFISRLMKWIMEVEIFEEH